jgi:microsomal dipeptidase-like Zn-dependent dipeptidase
MSPLERRSRRRLVWSGAVAAAVVASALAIPTSGAGSSADGLATTPLEEPHGEPGHSHDDPATKNQISRAGEVGEDTQDPTTAAQRRDAAAYVASERRLPDPQLTKVPATAPRTKVPHTRYAMANGCYRLAGQPIYFKPTTLGVYLLYDKQRRFVIAGGGRAAKPSPATEWTAQMKGDRFAFTNDGKRLRIGGTERFALTLTKGCARYPESDIDIHGNPFAGVTPYQEVRGYVDGHTHGMAFEFLGGRVHCGRPWHEYGAPYALVDCPDHTLTNGYGAILETFFSGEAGHDPVGWPTFKDWPAPNSLTHEGTYYRWLERAWRGGQRLFVNLLVENNKLCQIYPLKRNSCDDMDSIRLQAKDMYRMQRYIDAQAGGPGKGFYRIVTDPFQARRVINAGKMAVVMGIETSVPFGCTMKLDRPACSAAEIDRQLDEVHRLGVRQMELVNKFDNALSGVAGDQGEVGVVVNGANFLETGSFWDMRHCEPADGESHDNNQVALPDIGAGQQDALFGAIGQLFGALGSAVLPLYPPPDHCNNRGLTTLGEFTIKGLAKRGMIFDPDHMSVKGRKTAMNQLEKMGYPGIISSHSWATPDAYPRVYKAGGFITPYAGDSTGFVDKWRRHIGWADKRFYWGIGFGADINGLGAQGDPRGAGVRNKVTYPFRGLGGVRIERQHAGKRVYDINVDGVAQYGLYPDWIEDLRKLAGAKIVDDMSRGPEAYLQMWERAVGMAPDSCRNPGLRKSVAGVRRLVHRGMSTKAVMRAVGQPFTRLGTSYGVCAKTTDDPKVMVTIRFDRSGRVSEVTSR